MRGGSRHSQMLPKWSRRGRIEQDDVAGSFGALLVSNAEVIKKAGGPAPPVLEPEQIANRLVVDFGSRLERRHDAGCV